MSQKKKPNIFFPATLRLSAFALILLLAVGLVFVLSNFLERNRVAMPPAYEDSDLALQGKRLKGFALGAEGLIADWYWMLSLQYIGNKFMTAETDLIDLNDLRFLNPRLLYPYLDNATDLDPKFMAAYTYGATVLPAIDPAKAIQLTEKGIANNPGQWRLYQHLGYIYWRLNDYQKAAQVYEEGSQIAGAPQFMKMMAAAMKTRGGDRETARAIYQQMRDEAVDRQTRDNAEFRLMEIDSLEERDAIRAALRKVTDSTGKCPQSFGEIFPLLRWVKLPGGKDFVIDKSDNIVDPSGAPYLLDRENCDVRLDPAKTKIPLQ